MHNRARRPTITSPTVHIRSYNFRPFLALILTGCVLCFVAGCINAISLVSLFRAPLSASTGTSSRMAIELAKGNVAMALHLSLLILSFVLGSFISAALVGGSSFRIQRSYGLVLVIECCALAFGYLFENISWNVRGTSASLQVGAYLVSFACGLQNGMCTTFSGAVIRTTHVTGILTDIGLILGQALFYPRTRKHLWKLKVLLPLYIVFCLGGVVGWFAYHFLQTKAILVPCAIVGILGVSHLCYCKIILMYRTKQVNKKHWRRNTVSRVSIPTVETDENINNGFEKPTNEIEEDQQDGSEKTSFVPEPPDLHTVSIHDSKTNIFTS